MKNGKRLLSVFAVFAMVFTLMFSGSAAAAPAPVDPGNMLANAALTVYAPNVDQPWTPSPGVVTPYPANSVYQANLNFAPGTTSNSFTAGKIELFDGTGTTPLATNTAKPLLLGVGSAGTNGITGFFGTGDAADPTGDSYWVVGAYPAGIPTKAVFTFNDGTTDHVIEASLTWVTKPAAPAVTANDGNDTITGLDNTMEYSVDGQQYVKYDGTNLSSLSGNHSVSVRVATVGTIPAGEITALQFAGPIVPVISNVSIKSNNDDPTRARIGDTVTLTFTTAEKVSKLGNFKINGSNPTTFSSVGSGIAWVNTATYVLEDSDPEGVVNFQINVQNALGVYSITTEATTDGSLVTVTKSPEILSVSIASNNADKTMAKPGDTLTLTFKTVAEMVKLDNFKINGGNPKTFTSTRSGSFWTTVATYMVDDTDPNGIVTFQINAKSLVGGYYTVTTEATTDGSSVTVMQKPVISSVHLESSNTVNTRAVAGDTVTLTFKTNQQVTKLGNFKINGSNLSSFKSEGSASDWLNTATYVLDETDIRGPVTFQINVQNALGVYSITTEETTDGTSVQVMPALISLPAAIAAAQALTEQDYTYVSWLILTDALALPETNNKEIGSKVTAINDAIEGLVNTKEYMQLMRAEITGVDGGDVQFIRNPRDYTPESWSSYSHVIWIQFFTSVRGSSKTDIVFFVQNMKDAVATLVLKPLIADEVTANTNILLVGDYAFDLNNVTVSQYNLNNFVTAARTAYESYEIGTGNLNNHVYFKLAGKWYDLVVDPTLQNEITDLSQINGNGRFQYRNMVDLRPVQVVE